jgi:hypothetical protein
VFNMAVDGVEMDIFLFGVLFDVPEYLFSYFFSQHRLPVLCCPKEMDPDSDVWHTFLILLPELKLGAMDIDFNTNG